MPRQRPPANDEFEVSIFGPGIGESAVIHTGDGRWIIVDACEDSRDGTVAPLAYFDNLGLDPAQCVDWVVATHAHDDHIAGFGKVVIECTNAQVVLPAASEAMEFLAIGEIDKPLAFYDTRWSVYNEYRLVFKELNRPSRRVHYASAGTVLPFGSAAPNLQLIFVAPSGEAVSKSKRAFSRLLKAATQKPAGRVAERDPNTFSIALVVSIGEFQALLGGDVRRGSSKWGWKFAHSSYPMDRVVRVHKVPHHGSRNAYWPNVWSDWLSDECVNFIAPYRSSSLPRPDVISEMKRHGMPLWATASSGTLAASAAVKRARVMARDVAPRIDEEGGIMGQVRFRQRPGSLRKIETFGPAFEL